MGEGRNALFLARAGWQVTGFDPADKAVALAQQRAATLGLSLTARVATDAEFDFGDSRWDLIVYSWVPPTGSLAKAIAGLRPGGLIVVEAGRAWFPQNGLLKMFEALRTSTTRTASPPPTSSTAARCRSSGWRRRSPERRASAKADAYTSRFAPPADAVAGSAFGVRT